MSMALFPQTSGFAQLDVRRLSVHVGRALDGSLSCPPPYHPSPPYPTLTTAKEDSAMKLHP